MEVKKKYKILNGISYHINTSNEVINVLDECYRYNKKVRLYYGDTKTGKTWNDEHDMRGHIGRSTGTIKIPLIVHPLSYGGPALLDHCILKIVSNGKTLYQHKKFQQPDVTIKQRKCNVHPFEVFINGELHGRCKTERQAKLLRTKMS